MSAKVEVLYGNEIVESRVPEFATTPFEVPRESNQWSPKQFAHEQILGLVRRVFFANSSQPVKQVVFSAVEARINVAPICEQVAWAISLETSSQIVLVNWENVDWENREKKPSLCSQSKGSSSIKSRSTQLAANLWRVRAGSVGEDGPTTGIDRLTFLAELRDQFEFAIIRGPAAGISSEAALLGQIADGLILVIGANTTRRATAKQIKQTLQASKTRILGTVLCDRTFPIPQGIYSRL
jgi:hypothetical protein